MEKVKAKRSARWQLSDFGLRILALILAVIVWLILSITQYPTINKTITNVPVVFSMEGTSADEKGLQARDYKDITVDVEIKGMNYEIGSYTANDLVATVNLDNVTKEGTYPLEIEVKSSHASDRISVVSVTPDTVDVSFVHIGNYEFDVTPSAPNVSAEQGKTLRNTTVTPSTVSVSGAETDLKKIAKVEARIDTEMTLSEQTVVPAETIMFYDESGAELDSSKYTLMNNKKFDITFEVYKKKTVELTVDYSDCPPGFKPATIPGILSEKEISVITPKLDDKERETLSLGTVSLNSVKKGASFDFDVNGKLSSGEINQSGIDTVTLTFDFDTDDYIEQNFIVSSNAISIINAPTGTNIAIETKQLPSVTMFGPRSVISKLTAGELTAVVDLSDVAATGSLTHVVTVYCSKYDNIWSVGEQTVEVVISTKGADSSSESESE
ncbi:MAG: hypothetical protein IKP47_06550 [Ruminococcus sp.]|nr:hypothetical protein [Ruminococcus sp.]